jgi:alpha-1,2-mannosyltransferase
LDFIINAFFYKCPELVPWNIVKYNIFSSAGGPNLYGTEPWTFYFKNLALNFNVWFVLALLALPLFLLQKVFSSKQGFQSGMRTFVFITPFYMWLGIFSLQPHKEERFMYPAYPFLALNAAISCHVLLAALGNADRGTLLGKIPARLKLLAVSVAFFLSLDLGLARVYGLYSAYSAPMRLYAPLGAGVRGQQGLGGRGDNVCFGKEWYRFPSSYFLPRDMHAKFIRSEFHGLLPGEFSEARTGFGFWSGTWLPTAGMNGQNLEDPGKYVDPRVCNFLVDTQYPERTDPLPPDEPDYVADEKHWEVVKCVPFLDAANTSFVARALWLPDLEAIPERYRRKWGRHCLLRKK